jgi:hypothetical protein
MRNVSGKAALVVALVVVPALAAAQHGGMGMTAKHELGVDLTAFYAKPSGGSGNFNLMTPVDVRLGFASKGTVMFEPRFALAFASGAGGGSSSYFFSPDLNLLFGKDHKKGMYLTAGAGVNLFKLLGTSASQLSINGGIGTRSPYESGAIRLEGFVRYNFKNTAKLINSSLDIGARVGISLWH